MNADVESSRIISVPCQRTNIDTNPVNRCLVSPRTSRTLFHTGLRNIFSKVVDWTVDRSHAYSGLVIGEDIEGVASSHTDSEPPWSRNQCKGVEIRAFWDTTASVIVSEHAGKGRN